MNRPLVIATATLAALLCGAQPSPGQAADEAEQRRQLVAAISDDVERTARSAGRERLDPQVMGAMVTVPRHEFVPANLRRQAYANRPLPIGHGQTISQPFIVALMTDLLATGPGERVLEIGTGSGYQAAILAEMGAEVYSIEIVEPLGLVARERLEQLGYQVITRIGDGYFGWEEHAPFDAIVVTAAASHVPPPLVRQLAPGGVMVLPVGSPFQVQQLTIVRKSPAGEVSMRQILPVRFVPLTGDR